MGSSRRKCTFSNLLASSTTSTSTRCSGFTRRCTELRQAPCAWNQKLDAELLSLGFTRCVDEHGMYTHGEGGGRLIVGVYVDDLIITGGDAGVVAKFKM